MNPEAYKTREKQIADEAAPRSLNWYRDIHGILSQIEISTVLSHLKLLPSDRVIEVGSGVGRITLELAKHVKSVLAVDISPKSIEQLRIHAMEFGLTNIEGVVSDVNLLQVKPGTIDKAVAVEVLQHVPSDTLREDAVSRIFRLLRPGGIFVTVNYRWGGQIGEMKEGKHKDGRYRIAFTPMEMEALLARCGFKGIRVRGCVNLPYRLVRCSRYWVKFMTSLDVSFSYLPFSSRIGKFLLVIGEKES